MALITNLILFIISCIALVLSGSWLVKSLLKIASFLRISEFVAGFIIMAIATSLPELFVGITSALTKNAALVLGTVIGSNIANLTIIIGIPILLARGITIRSPRTKTDALYLVFISIVPLILMLIGRQLNRIDGIILIAVFLIYARRMYMHGRIFKKEYDKNNIKRITIFLTSLLFIANLAILFFAAKFVVQYAAALSTDLALPHITIGLFLIAIGTSLPELIFGSQAVLKRHSEMALGNIIGSNIANLTLVLGITAIIYPITSDFLLFVTSGIYMLIITFIFATFVESGDKLYIKEGISLILFYIFFIIIELSLKGIIG